MLIIETKNKTELIDITDKVEQELKKQKVKTGLCIVYVPHATAGLIINENWDEGIKEDIITALGKLIPDGVWKHDKVDNNGAAHIKAAIIGPSVLVPVKNGELELGTWQGIGLCEFDGPRKRHVFVRFLTNS